MSKTRILIVDDEAGQRDLLAGYLATKNFDVTSAGGGEQALELYPSVFAPVAVLDMKMPGMNGLELLARLKKINPYLQAIVLTAFGSVETAVAAMKAGAFDYLSKPVEDLDELLLKLNKAAEQNRLIVDREVMEQRLTEAFPHSEILGESSAMKTVHDMIGRVGPQDATVLITGPSGTGKELVARALHAVSPRKDQRLVAVNCAAFPETLLESELFGHEKGAFTGAERLKQGRFELADSGTLFLDEIGEIPSAIQVKLLRAIEERRIQRLGATDELALDIRIIAATNRDLEQMVRERTFREDLFYRLNVIRIELPPLAERGGDVLLLAEKFLKRYAKRTGRQVHSLEPGAAQLLSEYSWPGNVRELENVIERAVLLSRGDAISAGDLAGLNPVIEDISSTPVRRVRPMSEVEKDHIKFCLDQLNWNMALTAEKLGIHRNTLRTKIKDYQLSQD